jgi:hypothetical protein
MLGRRGALASLGAGGYGAAALIALALAGTTGLALLAPGAEQLLDYWLGYYLATAVDDPAKTLSALGRWTERWVARLMHANRVHTGPLPSARAAGWALALLGIAHLARRGRGAHLTAGVLVVLAVWVASALGRIPLGVQRIETFLLPYGAVALASAAGWSESLRGRGTALAAAALLPLLLTIQLRTARRPAYPVEESAPVVARLARELAPEDGIWSNITGTWALSVYGPWPSRFEPNQRLGVPHPVPAIEHFEIMDPRDDQLSGDPPNTERIFLFVCYIGPHLRAPGGLLNGAIERLEAAGYVARESLHKRLCSLQLMTLVALPANAAN